LVQRAYGNDALKGWNILDGILDFDSEGGW
jgi:hypothetical protein